MLLPGVPKNQNLLNRLKESICFMKEGIRMFIKSMALGSMIPANKKNEPGKTARFNHRVEKSVSFE